MNEEKRMAGDYEIVHATRIGMREIVVGQNCANVSAPSYMCGFCETNELMRIYTDVLETYNYAEAMHIYGDRISDAAEQCISERSQRNVPEQVITAEDCYPNDYRKSIEGTVIAIRPDELRPEYRYADYQLCYVVGGFGSHANSRGRAVFCNEVFSGEKRRYSREQVLGVVRPGHLPEWAVDKVKVLMDHEKCRKSADRER